MTSPTSIRRRTRVVAFAALAALLLTFGAGCGDTEGPEPLSDTEHNSADVTFAQDMIQHHAQALAMVNLTANRSLDPDFTALTAQIREAQVPEIETMVDWLREWEETVPETSNDHEHADMGTMPEGMEDMPGAMSADEMSRLEAAADADFSRIWLEMMIRHHDGAIEMAEAEQAQGRFAPAVDLAKSISESQSAEINEMKALLAAL